MWTAELWVISHLQALKPQGDKYKGFVVSSFEAVLGLAVYLFIYFTACCYLKSSQLLSVVPHLSAPSLFRLSLREHRYHRASGPAGNLDCGGGNGCLRLQTEAEVSK